MATDPGVNATDALCGEVPAGAIAANSPVDLTTRLVIANPDYNFSQVVTTSPGSGFLAGGPGHGTHAGGTDPALGDVMGRLISDTKLGTTNQFCGITNLSIPFVFLNATVDNTAGNLWLPLSVAQSGNAGTLENHQSDTGSASSANGGAGVQPNADGSDTDLDGTVDEANELLAANGLPAAVERYPAYLNSIFDPDFVNYGADGIPDGTHNDTDADNNGATPPVQPIQRLHGQQIVSNSAVELELLIFAPGVLAAAFPAPHPFADLVAELGYTTITVLQNPTATAAPSAITDFCAGLATMTTVFGESKANACNGVVAPPCNQPNSIGNPNTGATTGRDRARTPAASGTYAYVGFAASLRDADGDGFENPLDTCPNTAPTAGESPKANAGPDGDMIDSACDATPGANTGANNHDGDVAANGGTWDNAGDNCPVLANGDQQDAELDHSYYEASATNPAPNSGPKTDAIGDICDPDDVRANGDYLASLSYTAKCIGTGVDADDDGFCAGTGAPLAPHPAPAVQAFDPNDGSAAVTPEDYDMVYIFPMAHASAGDNPPERQPAQVCNDGANQDGDADTDNNDRAAGNSTCRPAAVPGHPNFPACPVLGCTLDSDGDGATDEAERHMGTNPLARCGVGAVPAQSSAWPIDFTSGGIPLSTDKITITDLTSFTAPTRRLDTEPSVDAGFNVRWDILPGPAVGAKWIQIGDLTALFAGSNGFPPQSSGAKVFGTAFACTAHPIYGN